MKKLQNVSKLLGDPEMATAHQLGPFRLDGQAGILYRGAEPVGLGQRAVALLRVLVESAGAPVSKDVLIEAGWAGLVVEEGNLTVQIAAVRRVLGREPSGGNWIETLPRRGYRYIGPVSPAENESSVAAPMTETTPGLSDKPSIAVLPFQNLCDDPEQEYFADGMVEEIITGLARIKGVLVIARNSSFIYRGKAVDVKQIGRELGARYVLEGSVRRASRRPSANGTSCNGMGARPSPQSPASIRTTTSSVPGLPWIVMTSDLCRSRSVENRPGMPSTWSTWPCVSKSRSSLPKPAPLRSNWRCVPSPQSTMMRWLPASTRRPG
jgi:TolB-like protein